jgi:hypothetical protein
VRHAASELHYGKALANSASLRRAGGSGRGTPWRKPGRRHVARTKERHHELQPWKSAPVKPPLVTEADDLLHVLVRLVVTALPGCDEASIAVLREGSPLAIAASGLWIRRLTELQYRQGTGPSWQATTTTRPTLATVPPDGVPDGWEWIARACGLTEAMSIPIPTADDAAGVLNVYTTAPAGWPPDAEPIARALATRAGRSLATARAIEPAANSRRRLRRH